jgi:two-component sensor histidine kinase
VIGTRYGGLFVYRQGSFRQVSIDDGLISNGVYALSDNADRTWWAGTGSGLQAVDAHSFTPRKPIKELTGQIVYVCGLVPNDYVWSLSAGPETSLLTLHELTGSTENKVPPPVYITTLLVNSRPQNLRGTMEFDHDQNTLTVEFVGLSFKDERETRFQHRLVGGRGEWSAPSDQRSVTYAGLVPGDYIFEVRAFNNDGVVSATSGTLSFSISPPFWRTWWFFLGTSLAIAGGLWGLYRYRVSGILALERMRYRIARDLHDDVGGTLSGITHLAEAAAVGGETDKTTQRLLRRIAESSSAVQASLDDIVWSLNPTPDTWEILVAKCRRYASDLCEARGIHHAIDIASPAGNTVMSPLVKENFWLLFKEIVTNAVKHSGATSLIVRLSLEDATVKLHVEDNGRGFDPGLQTNRNGLRNLRQRADALGAVIRLVTAPGNGTCWSVSFRVHR